MKTIYINNYENELNEMLDKVIAKYGYEHEYTIYFARLCEKYAQATYTNRETMRRVFGGLMLERR